MYKSIHIGPPLQPYSHSHNYYSRFIQMTRLQTNCGSTSPQLLVSLLPFQVRTILVPAHSSRSQSGCHLPSRNPPQKCLNSKSSNHIIPRFKSHQSHSNNPHALRNTRNGQVIYHSQDRQGKDISIWCLIVAHQICLVKFFHRALEFSQSNLTWNVFMVLLHHGIDKCLPMARLSWPLR